MSDTALVSEPVLKNLSGADNGLQGDNSDENLQYDIQDAIKKASLQDGPAEKDKVSKIMTVWSSGYNRWQPYYREIFKNFKYLRNDQIAGAVREQLKADYRPEVEFNFLLSLVVYISGMINKNRSKIRAIPTASGDEDLSALHTLITDWAIENCDGDYELAIAARNAAIAGIGWVNNYWDIKNNKWVTRSVSPFKAMFNPDAESKEDQKDWTWMAYQDFFTAEKIISLNNLTGQKADMMRERARELEGPYKGRGATPPGMLDLVIQGVMNFVDPYGQVTKRHMEGIDMWGDNQSGLYRVVEFHDRRIYNQRILYNPTTDEKLSVPLPIMNDTDLLKRVMNKYSQWFARDKQIEEFWITSICPKLLPFNTLQEQAYPVQGVGFQIKPIFCYDFDPAATETKSLLSNLISVQDYINQRLMSEMNYILEATNPDTIATVDSIPPDQLEVWKSKLRGKLKLYVEGINPPKKEHPMPELAPLLERTIDRAVTLIPNLSSIPLNARGISDTTQENGVLFHERVQAGLITLEHLFGHIQRAQEEIWRFTDRNLQVFLDTQRIVRIAGTPPPGMQGVDRQTADAYWLKINWETVQGYLNDLTQGEYDFQCDETQLGKTAKQVQFREDMELLKTAASIDPKQAQVILPMVVEESDSPMAKKMAERMEKILIMQLGDIFNQMQGNLANATGGQQQQQNQQQIDNIRQIPPGANGVIQHQ